MHIVHYNHPALRFKSSEVKRIDNGLRQTVARMFELMYAAKGIGLAANQVGLPFRFFIVNLAGRPDQPDEELVFINPEIVNRRGSAVGEEGCLSLPGYYADVRRAEEVVVQAFDLQGLGFEMSLDDLPARVVQHETDHLDGVMFTDRIAETDRPEADLELAKFESRFRQAQSEGYYADDATILSDLERLARTGAVPPPATTTPPTSDPDAGGDAGE